MSERAQDRLFAASGIASVVLVVAGSLVGSGGGEPSYTLDSTRAHIAHELAKPVGSSGWAGAYLQLISFGLFLAFAVWASAKLGGGVLGALARATAVSYTTLNVVALGVADALGYRAGHGVGAQLGIALATRARHSSSPAGSLVPSSWPLPDRSRSLPAGDCSCSMGDRIAVVTLVATPALVEHGGQVGYFLWLIWIVAASIALARGKRVQPSSSQSREAQAPRGAASAG